MYLGFSYSLFTHIIKELCSTIIIALKTSYFDNYQHRDVPALAHHTDFPSVSWAVVIIHVNHLCVIHVLVEALSVGRDICSSTRPSHGLPECQLGSGNYPRQSPLCDPCACRSSLCRAGHMFQHSPITRTSRVSARQW